MTANQFTGPRAKLRAVRRHGKTFREEMSKYIEGAQGGGLKAVVKPPTTYRSIIADLPPVPEDLSVIAGEIAYQSRSSLDVLACDLARWSGATNVNDVYFPIAKTSEGYFDPGSRNKIKKLTPELREMIDGLQ